MLMLGMISCFSSLNETSYGIEKIKKILTVQGIINKKIGEKKLSNVKSM